MPEMFNRILQESKETGGLKTGLWLPSPDLPKITL